MADIGVHGEELYRQVLPLHGPDPAGLAHDYVGAVSLGAREIDDLVRDSDAGPGWSVIVDVDDVPAKGLRWLAQVRGVVLRPIKRVVNWRNRVPDPSAEGLAANWVFLGAGGAVTSVTSSGRTTSWASSGLSSAHWRAQLGGSGTLTPITIARSTVIDVAVTPGETISFGCLLRVDAHPGGSTLLRGQMYAAPGGPVGGVLDTPATPAVPGVYVVKREGVVVPATATRLNLVIRTNAAAPPAEAWISVDDVIVATGPTLPAFALPGRDEDALWDGAPNASTVTVYRDETLDEWAVDARERIRNQSGADRGKPSAIASAAGEALTGTKSVRVTERVDDNAYRIGLVTLPGETPDPSAIIPAVINARQKPAGVRIMYAVQSAADEAIVDEGLLTIDEVDAAVTIDAATLADVT